MTAHQLEKPLITSRIFWAALPALLLFACGSNSNQGTLTENVGASFAPCNPAEIRLMKTKHNMMTAFRECGQNNFTHFAWSPDGKNLYFQLVMTGFVMDAEAKTRDTAPVPVPSPIGPGVWLTNKQLAIPVGPTEDGGLNRIALFDTQQRSVFFTEIDAKYSDIDYLQRGRTQREVLVTAVKGGKRVIVAIDTNTHTNTEPFSWTPDGLQSMSYTHALDVFSLGANNTVTLHQASDGVTLGSWTPATAGSLHHSGEWMMLEHLGDPIGIFYQRSWDELSEKARQRELRRAEQFLKTIPKGMPTEIQPPVLSFASVETGRRFELSSVYGYDFQWYEPTDYYGSFLLWGFEGKQYKRNVMLGDFGDRMNHMLKGKEFMGVSEMISEKVQYKKGQTKLVVKPPPVVPKTETDAVKGEVQMPLPKPKDEKSAPKAPTK